MRYLTQSYRPSQDETFASALVSSNFVEKCSEFVMDGCPPCPPPQTETLHEDGSAWLEEPEKSEMKNAWTEYLAKAGLLECLKVVVPLAVFGGIQNAVGADFVATCFWLSNSSGVGEVGERSEAARSEATS